MPPYISDKLGGVIHLDMMTAVRLRMTGHSKEDVQAAITVMSPSLRQELGKDPNVHKWEDYAARTAAAAFGYYGDREAQKLERFREYWKDLEAPPKPLSAEADKERLAELRRLRDEAAEAYADPIMEKEKQEKLTAIKAQRPAAEQALAKARSALETHEETDVELTFFERTFGGKSADVKIAAYDKRTAELRSEVKKCSDVISDLDYREEHPFGYGDREIERRKALETRGRDRYDKAHPEEVREREMLEELYEKCRIGYVSNPISQPSGHKYDIERAARIIEKESSRGLTEAETVAKHDGVRKVSLMTTMTSYGRRYRDDK